MVVMMWLGQDVYGQFCSGDSYVILYTYKKVRKSRACWSVLGDLTLPPTLRFLSTLRVDQRSTSSTSGRVPTALPMKKRYLL